MNSLDDPFDLDDHRPRRATELDDFIAAGVREVEAKREADAPCPECDGVGECWDCAGTGESEDNHDCPECDGTGECWDCGGTGESQDNHEDDGECSACYGMGECSTCNGDGILLKPGRPDDPATDLSRAWEAASGEGQVTS